MVFLDGYFTTTFFPVAIYAFLGIAGMGTLRGSKCFREILLTALIFATAFLWRIPVVTSGRYMLPLVVPGLLLAVVFFKLLSRLQQNVGKYLCGVLLIGTAAAGAAKAMRFQEPKPYLTEIPALVSREMASAQNGCAIVLELGNLGGIFDFADSVRVWKHNLHLNFSDPDDQERFWSGIGYFEPECKLLQYPVMYIIIRSLAPAENFVKNWHTRYGRVPELCYEYIRPKDQCRHQMFRIRSPFPSASLEAGRRQAIFEKFNVLSNPDFSRRKAVPEESPDIKELLSRGIQLQVQADEIQMPEGWRFDLDSWKETAVPAGLGYAADGALRMFGKAHVGLVQNAKRLSGGRDYQLSGTLTANTLSIFQIQAQQMVNGRVSGRSKVFAEVFPPGRHEFSGLVKLADKPGEWQLRIGLYYGDIELEKLWLIEQSAFDGVKQ